MSSPTPGRTKEAIRVIFDTGASISISPHREDFIGDLVRPGSSDTVSGLSGDTTVAGIGTVRWSFLDDYGKEHVVETAAYYVPTARVRLFSPQTYMTEQQTGSLSMDSTGFSFWFDANPLSITQFICDPRSNLPICKASVDRTPLGVANLSVIDDQNTNLTDLQKELMKWHWKIGHFHFQWIQSLMREHDGKPSVLVPRHPKASSCPSPLCASCQFGKQSRRPTGSTHLEVITEMALRRDHLKPGQMVSIDQCGVSTILQK